MSYLNTCPAPWSSKVDKPGTIYEIDCYEATLVPPIWLVNDPRPRYPDELRIVSRQPARVCALAPTSLTPRAAYPA
jgi:hypothetical protein